jgi:hypothetical protein
MSIESKRIDLILDEFDQPAIVEPQIRTNIIPQKRTKPELVNDYVDLYKNFNEFNARYNPRRAEEIRVGKAKQEIDPYHVNRPVKAPDYIQHENERYMSVGYTPASQYQPAPNPVPDSSSVRINPFPKRAQKVAFEDTAQQEPMMLDNFRMKNAKPESYRYTHIIQRAERYLSSLC